MNSFRMSILSHSINVVAIFCHSTLWKTMWTIRCILLWSNEYTYYESITRDYHVYLGGGSLCLAPCNVWSFFWLPNVYIWLPHILIFLKEVWWAKPLKWKMRVPPIYGCNEWNGQNIVKHSILFFATKSLHGGQGMTMKANTLTHPCGGNSCYQLSQQL